MASLNCKYCGSYINDTDEVCPECGAVNEHYKRVSDGTPRTIEELKSWYRARSLPPEETTRFFIGKDIKEPRAFGIYEENGRFIVYKNKSDGSRAVRYEGRDEAYAVNELYLRLKEEILNQKALNVKKANHNSISRSKNNLNNISRPAPKKQRSPVFRAFLTMSLMMVVIIVSFLGLSHYITITDTANGYYVTENELYYYDGYNNGEYVWWKYDVNNKKWSIYETLYSDDFILGLDGTNRVAFCDDAAEMLGLEYDDIYIYNSKDYVDAGHHYSPNDGYYSYNNDLYYYLDDNHSDYGDTDNSGWYKWDTTLSDWEYFSSYDNKELVPENLWYCDDDYYVGDVDDETTSIYDWNAQSFTSTTWYNSYLENESAYNAYYADRDNDSDWDNDDDWDWSSDSDYDWDSDSDWDSGGSDWDSDW